MAKKGLRNSPSYKAAYKNYTNNNTWLKNKIKKLEKTVKLQPNNMLAVKALKVAKAGDSKYTRNHKGEHKCKGFSNLFGYVGNKPQKFMGNSYLWYTSSKYNKWFMASAPKVTKYQNVKSTLSDAEARRIKV